MTYIGPKKRFYPHEKLPCSKHLDWAHCVGWIAIGNGDPWSKSVWDAKKDKPKGLRVAKKCLQLYVKSLKLPKMYTSIFVVPIIPHDKKHIGSKDRTTKFAKAVTKEIAGAQFVDDALKKKKHKSLSGEKRSAAQRDKIIKGVYRVDKSVVINKHSKKCLFLLVDDVLTRGTTMNDAARAIRDAYGSVTVGGLAAGKWAHQFQRGRKHLNHDMPKKIRKYVKKYYFGSWPPPPEEG